jgi:hypothetical protein
MSDMTDANDPRKPAAASLEQPAPNVTVIRFLEYHGPAEWIQLVLDRSVIPIQGAKGFPDGRLPSGATVKGSFIRSGLVMFQEEEATGVVTLEGNVPAASQVATVPSTVELDDGKGGKTVIHLPMPPGGKTQA